MGRKFSHSTPYKSQENGQAEFFNKILMNILKKKLEEDKGRWMEDFAKHIMENSHHLKDRKNQDTFFFGIWYESHHYDITTTPHS